MSRIQDIQKLRENREQLEKVKNSLINSCSKSTDSGLNINIEGLKSIKSKIQGFLTLNVKIDDDLSSLNSEKIIALGVQQLNELRIGELNKGTHSRAALRAFSHEYERGNCNGGYYLGLVFRDHLNSPERACSIFRDLHNGNHLKSTLELIVTLQELGVDKSQNNSIQYLVEAEKLKHQL